MAFPHVRFVEAVQIEHEGQPAVLIRDPECLCEGQLVMPLPMFAIMAMLDGRHGVPEIQQILAQATGGQIVSTEMIEQAIAEFDRHYLLENERAALRRASLEESFASLLTRPASHAGQAYPEDEDACRRMFDEFYDGLSLTDGHSPRPRGLMVPHIDLRVGGQCLARTLAKLDPARSRRLYIILGVAHHVARNLFTLTDKSFETPLGLVQTDRAAAQRLREIYGGARLGGELAHKNEHSVEFAALALQYHHARAPEFKILPILCGPLHEESIPGSPAPAARPEVGEFIAALRQLIDEYDGEVCVIASVDLSHVGLKFGDEQGVDHVRSRSIREADEGMLKLIEAMDPEAFFDSFRADANARNVDAVTAVYVMLHTLGQGRAEPVDYQQWYEAETDSMVTFGGMALY